MTDIPIPTQERTKEKIQNDFQQAVYEYGWLKYRIQNSEKEARTFETKIMNLLEEAEAKGKLEANAVKVPEGIAQATEGAQSGTNNQTL